LYVNSSVSQNQFYYVIDFLKGVFMKLFNSLTKKLLAAAVTITAIAGISTAAIAGFGPDRPTKAWNPTVEGFDHVTFNSFTGVGNGIGDERDFLRGGIIGNQDDWADPVNNVPDTAEVEVKIYIHNGADARLNDQPGNPGVAKDVNVRVAVPTDSRQSHDITSWISASNAQPQTIFDTVTLTGANGGYFQLTPVPGSAQLYTDGVATPLSDAIFANGVNIGDQKGCFEYTREVVFRVKVAMPNYSISKQVKITGSDASWSESVEAKATDTISWLITFTNIGNTELTNVKVVDNIPANMEVVPGSVKLTNGNYPNGYVYPDSAIQADGRQVNVDIGNYNPGILGYVTFKTTIKDAEALECGMNTFLNEAYTTPTGYGAIRDTASVDVKRVCEEEPEKPVYACKDLSIQKLGGRKIKVNVTYTGTPADRVVFKNIEYNFGDGSTPLVSTNTSAEYTYAKDGTYNVSAKVTFEVDGETKTVSGENCSEVVTFSTTPTEIPNTGAGSLIGVFVDRTLVSMLAYRAYAARQ